MIEATLLTKITTLSVADRMQLLDAIWQSLEPDQIPVTEDEKLLLDSRLADFAANPNDQSPWQESLARLRRSLP